MIEVSSPTSYQDQRVLELFEAGVERIWSLFPSLHTVLDHHSNAPWRILHGDDVLSGYPQLPGLSIPVREFFAD